jgi:predicted ATPase
VEHYQNTALFPLTDLFQRIWRFEAHETADTKLEKLTHALSQYRLPLEESVQLFAPLLSLPISEDTYRPLQLSPQRQRQKTLETIIAILLELAEHQPVLFILEDLHWTDPTTLEWLNLLIEQTPTTSMLTLLVNARRSFFLPPGGGCTRGISLILLGFKPSALGHCSECFGINQQSPC